MLLHTPSSEAEMMTAFSESLRLQPPNLPLPTVKTSKASRADIRTTKLAEFSVKILLSQLQGHNHYVAIPPEAELRAFTQHLLISTHVSTTTVILALLYVQRRFSSAIQSISPKCEAFVPSGCDGTNPLVRSYTFLSAYHVLTVGLILSTKFLEDHTHTNGAWADVSGLAARELSITEWQWLSEINFDIFVTANDYFAWVHYILPNQSDYPPGIIKAPSDLGALNRYWPSRKIDLPRRHSHESGLCPRDATGHSHLIYGNHAQEFKARTTPPPPACLVPPTSYLAHRRHSLGILQSSCGKVTAAPQPVHPLFKGGRHTPYYIGRRPSAPQAFPVARHRGSVEYEVPSKLSRLAAIREHEDQCRIPRLPGIMYLLSGASEDLN